MVGRPGTSEHRMPYRRFHGLCTWQSHAVSFSSALIGFTLVIAGMFTGSFIDRVERIVKQRHLISFPIGKNYYEFMESALNYATMIKMSFWAFKYPVAATAPDPFD